MSAPPASTASRSPSPCRPFRIRSATREDAATLLSLIRGLAEYEKAPQEVTNTVQQLQQDGWGAQPSFMAFLAEVPSECGFCAVGFALSFFAYSTWKGRCLYLEDLFVLPEHRGRGLGLALMCRCVELAHATQCRRVMWQALDWNTAAISFYTQKLGAAVMKDWLSLRLTQDGIADFRQRFAPMIAQLAAQEAELSSGNTAAAAPAPITPVEAVGQQNAVEQNGAVARLP